ncbi:MAG: lipolytic protein family [Acidimicrobiales bacterium]|jgi:lysophospholipase L1-like esterase|nr:lipolytic protein family [Acidimicrobiales bacterium]
MRPESVEPYVRGAAWPSGAGVSYPRADPADMSRLPIDTWATASLPVGIRLELVGDAGAIRVTYRTETDDLGYRGPGAGTTFAVWRGDAPVDEQKASLGKGAVELSLGPGDGRVVVYLPEGMKPTVLGIEAVGGSIEPAPRQPRWLCYGDSLAEGWIASGPSGAWPAIAGRRHGLDHVNLGYAGSARGELVSAEQIASLDAPAVVSVSHGTNCWTRIPHSVDQMTANTRAFLDVLRQGHPDTPIVVCSPVVRPDAEATPNRLGATLAGLRGAIETVAREFGVTLVSGDGLLTADQLPDRIHPGDEGHEVMADAFGGAVARAAGIA